MELESFGEFLFERFGINVNPNWEELITSYKKNKHRKRLKDYGMSYLNFMVAKKFDIDSEFLFSKSQQEKIVTPRHIACYLMSICGHTHEAIAEYYGKNTSTITNNIKSILGVAKTNRQIKQNITELENELL